MLVLRQRMLVAFRTEIAYAGSLRPRTAIAHAGTERAFAGTEGAYAGTAMGHAGTDTARAQAVQQRRSQAKAHVIARYPPDPGPLVPSSPSPEAAIRAEEGG